MPDISDDENEYTEDQTEDINEGGEENEDMDEDNEDDDGDEDQEENDEEKSEGGEENEEVNSTTEGAEGEAAAAAADDIEIDVENDSTHEVVKKLTMKEKFNDMERKKILIASFIFSLVISLPSGLGIGLGTAPVPDYCAYPRFKPCRDHGSCSMIDYMATCECDDGWDGELCQLKTCDHVDACVAENKVRCTFTKERGAMCICKEGYTGHDCATEIEVPDLCNKANYKDCNGHGTCEISDDLPTCTCDHGWMGITCEYMSCDNSEACTEHNYDSCSNVADRGAVCQCSDGYKGIDCSESTIDFGGMGK